MYVIIAPIQIKEGYKDRFIEEMISDARGSVNDEPGCLRFDIIQDASDPNRIWLYEVYKDQTAFEAHIKAPHFIKWRDAVKDWSDQGPAVGAGRGAYNIWPPDGEWK
jgi:autoinducer 2-degrading protein